jgi:integrase/recombinase XerD
MMARDSSCRPSELLKLKLKDLVFKMVNGRQFAEISVNGKTGSRNIPLINSLPYVKDYLDEHTSDPNSYIFRSAKTFKHLNAESMNNIYSKYKKEYFPRLLKGNTISITDKEKLSSLLAKPFNPYVQRHTSLTQKSKFLKEALLRNHAGWSPTSNMVEKYVHYFGNESNEAILEVHGLKTMQ